MNGSLAIPDGLREQFVKLEKRLWRFDAIVAVCGAVCSLLLSFALIFISDRLWDTPPYIRVIFTGAGVVAFGFFLYGYGRRWVWGDRSFPALASLVQRRYRRLGDRLLGIVELAEEHKRPANFSKALCKAAIDQVANEASKVDFQQAVGTKRPRQYFAGLMAAGILAAAFFIFTPQAGWNALMRWLKPTMDVSRYTFVSFDSLPDHMVVPHGEPFPLGVIVSAHSLLHPSEVKAQFENQEATSAPVKSGVAKFEHLAGQTEDITLTLSAGDVSHQMRIQPEFRPELKVLTAHIDLPSYLQYPAYDQKIEGGTLVFLKGSGVSFKGQATRNLQNAAVGVADKQTPLKIDRDTFTSAPSQPQGISQWIFSWTDMYGLDAVAPMKVRLQQKEDEAPQVDCRGMAGTIAILETEVVHVDIAAVDDYGILDVGVRWQTATNKSDKLSDPEDHKIASGAPQDKTVKAHYDFSPQLLHIPEGTSVAFCATATDRFPDRPASASSVHQIYILTKEEHAALIQDQFDKINAELEELTRRQESLLDAANTTRKQDPSKLASGDSEKKLDDQKNEQKEVAGELQKLAETTAETVKEAGKNPQISPASLQPWAKNAEAMNAMAQNSMPSAAQSLSQAESSPSDRPQDLDQAIKKEQEILAQMRQMEKDAEKAMEKMMTENLAARLRKIAGSEKSISDNFQKMLPDIIGAKADQLPDAQKKPLQDMVKVEDTSHKDSNKLQSEISRMFERTQMESYGDVSSEMDKSGTDDALAKLTQIVQDNVSVQVIQSAADWSKQFNLWADRLDPKDDSQSKPGEGEGSPEDMKALMALLKIRQQQDETREHTGALENQKAMDKDYADDAKANAKEQGDVQDAMAQLQADPDFPIPAEKLGPIANVMGEAKTLLDKPDTGDKTVADQTDAINMIDALIMQQAKKSGASMASLMAMMGSQPGKTPGKGYFGGGTTDRANEHIEGSRTGNASDARAIVKGSGNAGAQIPAEFRDAIESYQHAVEQESTPQ